MDIEKLVAAAVAAVVGALTKAAAEPLVAAGGKAWTWLKGKVPGAEAATIAAIEADPAKPSARNRIAALLQDVLHENPAAAKELAELLGGEAGVQIINQTATVTGDGNITSQIAGSGNAIFKPR